MEKKSSINLLIKRSLEEHPFWQKFFLWAINIGRVIIIGTELIVLIVFFSRFKLDAEISDLSESIENKQAIIAATSDLEEKIRELQKKLDLIENLERDKKPYSKALKFLTENVPSEISLLTLSLEKNKLVFTAETPSGTAFAKMIASLSASEKVKEIILTAGSFRPKENVFHFSLTTILRPEVFLDKSAESKVRYTNLREFWRR